MTPIENVDETGCSGKLLAHTFFSKLLFSLSMAEGDDQDAKEPEQQRRVIHVSGVVHPERVGAGLRNFELILQGPVSGRARLGIYSSQVLLTIWPEAIDVPEPDLRYYFQEVLGRFVHMLGFLRGCAYEVEVTGYLDDLGNQQIYGVDYAAPAGESRRDCPSLEQMVAAFSHPLSHFVSRVLDDIKTAALTFGDSGFYCYRAIEAMMQFFRQYKQESELEEKDAWPIVHSRLSTTKAQIMAIKEFADRPRHGGVIKIDADTRKRFISETVQIAERFFKFVASADR
jgi:hypothetical protein